MNMNTTQTPRELIAALAAAFVACGASGAHAADALSLDRSGSLISQRLSSGDRLNDADAARQASAAVSPTGAASSVSRTSSFNGAAAAPSSSSTQTSLRSGTREGADGVAATGELTAAVNGGATTAATAASTASLDDISGTRIRYRASDATIRNPERGLYYMVDCNSPIAASELQQRQTQDGHTLTMCSFSLRNFINAPISQSTLDLFQRNMDTIRSAGMKALVRFSYSSGTGGEDATLERMSSHLDQLQPYLEKNKDVITVLQAGLIGGWGEWAYSQNFGSGSMGSLTEKNRADRKALVEKLLKTVPAERAIQLRTPATKQGFYGAAPLSTTEAFNGTARARIGHHNDCFLASGNDWSTYANINSEYPYLASDTAYVPMGGETCNVNPPRSNCPVALQELEKFHWSYLNNGYHEGVISSFKSQGCFEQIQQRLGYRLVLQEGAYSPSAKPGGQMAIGFSVRNDGWAAPFNRRDVELVLRNTVSGATHRTKLKADPRLWLPKQTITVSETVALPANMERGNYQLFLNLSDPMTALRDRADYSIQLANENMWEDKTGFNALGHVMSVAP
jgi:hypothetical protein